MAVGSSCRRATRDTQESCQLRGRDAEQPSYILFNNLTASAAACRSNSHVSRTRQTKQLRATQVTSRTVIARLGISRLHNCMPTLHAGDRPACVTVRPVI